MKPIKKTEKIKTETKKTENQSKYKLNYKTKTLNLCLFGDELGEWEEPFQQQLKDMNKLAEKIQREQEHIPVQKTIYQIHQILLFIKKLLISK